MVLPLVVTVAVRLMVAGAVKAAPLAGGLLPEQPLTEQIEPPHFRV